MKKLTALFLSLLLLGLLTACAADGNTDSADVITERGLNSEVKNATEKTFRLHSSLSTGLIGVVMLFLNI